jgi:hypothetical protein
MIKKNSNKSRLFLLSTISSFVILTSCGYSSERFDDSSHIASHPQLTSKQIELISAVKAGDLPKVKRLINLEKVSKDTQDIEDDGDSLVHIAIKEQRQDIFNFFLKINCDTDIKNHFGDTPLHVAASNNYKKMLDELLEEESSNVNTQDNDGNTAFHEAIQKRNLECALSFMEASEKTFDYTLKNNKGMTVLDMLNKQTQGNSEYTAKAREIKDKITRFSNITVRTILQTEAPITPSVQNMASLMIQHNKKIFFSYCWNNEYGTKPMVDDFEALIKKLGITNYYRDVRDEEGKGMTSGTHIEDFMKNARDSDVVVIFLNNAYLKSRNCMYEFLQVWDENSKKVSPKVVIIRHPDFVSVFGGPSSALTYTNHWNEVFKDLRSKDISGSDIQWHNKEEGFVGKICSNITPILQELTSHIQSDYKQMRSKGFEDIFKLALKNEDLNLNIDNLNIQDSRQSTPVSVVPGIKSFQPSSSSQNSESLKKVIIENQSVIPGEEDWKNGLKLEEAQRPDYLRVYGYYRDAADKGHPNAITRLGILHYEGLGVTRNPEKAFEYFSKAASQDPLSMMKKGICLMEGEGVAKDYENAKKCFEDAVNRGHLDANVYLGKLFEEGWGIKKDYAQAFRLYEREAKRDCSEGMRQLGRMYNLGYAVSVDYSEAMRWYMKAAEKGNSGAMNSIGTLYAEGEGVREDYVKAREWYEKAAEKGDRGGMYNLGNLYYNGEGVREDYVKAREWYEKAAEKGDPEAMNNLGDLYYHSKGVRKDYVKAREWYEKAAEKGNPEAMNNLGDLYYNGEGVREDYVKAREWYEKAAEKGDADAMQNLGVLYQNGEGVKKDKKLAAIWLKKAKEAGYNPS